MLVGAISLLASATLTGCASGTDPGANGGTCQLAADWDSIVEAANAEAKVTWFSSAAPSANAGVIAGFQAKYPEIRVDDFRAQSGALQQRIEASLSAGQMDADVLTQTDNKHFERMNDEDRLAPIVAPESENPAWAELIRLDGHEVISNMVVFGPAWNVDVVPEGITTYDDLLDERFRGRIAMFDWVVAGNTQLLYNSILEERYPGLLEGIAELEPRFYAGSTPIAQALAAGEVDVALTLVKSNAVELGGGVVDFAVGDPVAAVVNSSATFVDSPHCNAAQVFIDYLMSEEGQAAFASNEVSPLPGIPGTQGGAELVEIVLDTSEKDQAFYDEWSAKLGEMFNR